MRINLLLAGVLLALAACTATGSPTSPPTTVAPSTTEGPTTTTGIEGCPPGEAFVAGGMVADLPQPQSDAEQIGAISWEASPACEVFTLAFATAQGAPATTASSIRATLLRQVGILRVETGVEVTAVTDQLVETELVGRLFVARKMDRRLFIDFHLSSPATARVAAGSTPGTITIELQPGGAAYAASPTIGPNIVLVAPSGGPLPSPIEISGYSRTFEATVVAVARQGSVTVGEAFTNSADWTETWGEFAMSLIPTSGGEMDLFVGELSAADGSEQGVHVLVDVS
jgi:hypothetical protein